MTIIAATDFSPESASALRHAAIFAAQSGQDLLCVHIIEELDSQSGWLLLVETPNELSAQLKAEALKRLERFTLETLNQLPVATSPEVRFEVREGHVIDNLLDLAQELAQRGQEVWLGAASKGRSALVAGLVGSTTHGLIRESTWPTLISPPEATRAAPIKHVLVPVDLGESCHQELTYAVALAKRLGAKLTLMYCIQWPTPYFDPLYPISMTPDFQAEARKTWRARLDDLAARADLWAIPHQISLVEGDPSTQILRAAQEHHADLICIGTHSRRGVRRLILGNTAERLMRSLPCSALVVPLAPA